MTKEVNSILNEAVWKTITGQLQWESNDRDGNYYSAELGKIALHLSCFANGTELSIAYFELPDEQLSLWQKLKIAYLRYSLTKAFCRRERERLFARRRLWVTEAIQKAREA